MVMYIIKIKTTKTMKVKELIKELQNIKDKEREIEILIGNEDKDFYTCSEIDLMHTLDNDETSVELFVNTSKLYDINTYKNFSEIKEIIGLSYPTEESDYLTIQMLDWDNKEIIIELSAYEWINWFDNKTIKRIGNSLNKIVTKKTSSKN